MTTKQLLTRGKLAKQCGVNPETIRYYERRELLPKARRSASNYRIYSESDVRRVLFIKRAQELGFTLRETGDLLDLRASPTAQCADVLERTEAKIKAVDQKIRALRAIRKALSRLTAECKGRAPVTDCPILESLDSDEES